MRTVKSRLEAIERRALELHGEPVTAEEQREQEALNVYLRGLPMDELLALEARLTTVGGVAECSQAEAEADGEPLPPGSLQVERALLLAAEGANP